jgi:hypothetical protein
MIPNCSEGWSMIWVLVPLLGLALVSRAGEPATLAAAAGGLLAFTLPALPYAFLDHLANWEFAASQLK